MTRSRVLGAGLVCLMGLVTVLPAEAAPRTKEPLVDQVRKAINDGVRFLRQKEEGRGEWEVNAASGARSGGWTSLALLALLNAGVKPEDPIIQRGLKKLREYPPSHTYVVGLQTMVFVEAGQNEDRLRIQRNVDWLVRARVLAANGELRGWTYTETGGSGSDNSNTQYALLGLHAGKTAGAKIDREVWDGIQKYYLRTQHADGGWAYTPFQERGATETMTVAGFCGLLISGLELNAGREKLQDGRAENCGIYKENEALTKAMGWISQKVRVDSRHHLFYNIYGIERAGRYSGERFFGEHDWYRRGCEYLVSIQKDDGSWYVSGQAFDGWPVVSTSFALLFLSKGRTPVLISKLVHGDPDRPTNDWNNDRNDCRHLVDYASRELFRKEPLAWQIFNARRVDVPNEARFLELVGDLLQAPIVYFNGHRRPVFTAIEKRMLQKYIEDGGFVLAEACCGQKEFDAGFRALIKELLPEAELKRLPPEHPIWRAHAVIPPDQFELWGVEFGCKTVVVYSPQDLSCLWEANQSAGGRGQLAFRLGGNLIAYATGMEKPRPRLTTVEVHNDKLDEKEAPRGYLKVAQLRHDGDWHVAPRAMRNLMLHLREKARLDVAIQTEPLHPADRNVLNYKLMYMHGRGEFRFDRKELEVLRANLETGALLLADSCCGKKPFDKAFRTFAEQDLFPGKKLEPIPLNDDLYSRELNNGSAITTVRCRRERADGTGPEAEPKDGAPFLEGIKIDNRWVLIYSKYDLGCALEKHQSSDCLGHDHASALRLASAAVFYALKR